MTDPVKEQLSACLDGQLPEAELNLLLRQVSRDPQLGASLGRYALIGEVLRARDAAAAPAGFSQRVAAAIAADPPLSASGPSTAGKPAQWLKPAAGLAVAAGVAAIAILSLQAPSEKPDASYVASAPTAADVPSPADSSYIVPANTSASGYVPAARLTNYVVAHSEYSTPLGRRSVLSGVLAGEADADSEELPAADSQSVDIPQP
jgi:sigma-E factor negative regulatory protein RseA